AVGAASNGAGVESASTRAGIVTHDMKVIIPSRIERSTIRRNGQAIVRHSQHQCLNGASLRVYVKDVSADIVHEQMAVPRIGHHAGSTRQVTDDLPHEVSRVIDLYQLSRGLLSHVNIAAYLGEGYGIPRVKCLCGGGVGGTLPVRVRGKQAHVTAHLGYQCAALIAGENAQDAGTKLDWKIRGQSRDPVSRSDA